MRQKPEIPKSQIEAIDKIGQTGIINWLQASGIKTHKKSDFEWKQHSFLLQPLTDWTPTLVFRKPTQIGVSTTAILKMLYKACLSPLAIIYTLPTTPEQRKFVSARIDPIVENSWYLREKLRPEGVLQADSTELKRIGDSSIYFKGSYVSHIAQVVDADILINDEYDFSKQEVLEDYEERLEGASSLGWHWAFSVPSVPNFGISKLFENSCQYYWFIRCSRCNHLQTLDFFQNVDLVKKRYICAKCKNELREEDRAKGAWVAKYPDRSIHGYQFSHLMCPWISAERIIEKREKARNEKHFFNYTLGLPYEPKGSSLADSDFWKLVGDYEEIKFGKDTIFGIDQGDVFHVAIGKLEPDKESNAYKKKIVALKIVDTKEKLLDLFKSYGMNFGLMDLLPNKHTAKELRDKLKGRLYLAHYQTTLSLKEDFDICKWDVANRSVTINRSESLDSLFKSLYDKKWEFPRLAIHFKSVVEHFKNLKAEYVVKYGRNLKVYRNTGPDHFAHAINLLNIAFSAPRFILGKSSFNEKSASVRYSGGPLSPNHVDIRDSRFLDKSIPTTRGGFTRVDVLQDNA